MSAWAVWLCVGLGGFGLGMLIGPLDVVVMSNVSNT